RPAGRRRRAGPLRAPSLARAADRCVGLPRTARRGDQGAVGVVRGGDGGAQEERREAPMRVAVTGAGGYLGRPIVETLAGDERVDSVVAIDLRPPEAAPGVEPLKRDVRELQPADLADVDVLVHLAARVLGRGKDAWSVNVDGSRNAFEAALRAGPRDIVHASSAAAYGCAPAHRAECERPPAGRAAGCPPPGWTCSATRWWSTPRAPNGSSAGARAATARAR